MKCRRLHTNSQLANRWHLLWCAECRHHAHVDAAIEATATRMRGVPVPAASRALVDRLQLEVGQAAPLKRSLLVPLVACGAIGCIAVVAGLIESRPSQTHGKFTTSSHENVAAKPTDDHPRDTPTPAMKDLPSRGNHPPHPESQHFVDHYKSAGGANDDEFLNPGRNGPVVGDANVAATVAAALRPPMRDDFVEPPAVLVASRGSSQELREMVALQEAKYAQEQKVTDPRLYANVTVSLKHASMSELCAELGRQTNVRISAGRNTADDNVTVFVTARPCRDVMREVSRLFGFIWERSGSDGNYTYVLRQDTKSQIAEQARRNADVEHSLQAVGDEASSSKKASSPRVKAARQLFANLSSSELDILRSGRPLRMTTEHSFAAEPLDEQSAYAILAAMGGAKKMSGVWFCDADSNDPEIVPFTKMKDPNATVDLQVQVTEFGGAKVNAFISASGFVPDGSTAGFGMDETVGSVTGRSEVQPDNAKANAALASDAAMNASVGLQLNLTTPLKDQLKSLPDPARAMNSGEAVISGNQLMAGGYFGPQGRPARPFMTSDDYWEAIHVATKRDVIADSFSRLFPKRSDSGKLFNVLSNACDALHYRWSSDEGFITGRSCSYYWQRLNEVPKRLLVRWQSVREQKGELPLADVLEMAQLSDRQLDAIEVGRTIMNQWRLWEYAIPSRPFVPQNIDTVRNVARFFASLPAPMLELAVQNNLHVKDVPRECLAALKSPASLEGADPDSLLGVEFVGAGKYYWAPVFEDGVEPVTPEAIVGNSPGEVESMVVSRHPTRHFHETGFSYGLMGLRVTAKNFTYDLGDQRFFVGHHLPSGG